MKQLAHRYGSGCTLHNCAGGGGWRGLGGGRGRPAHSPLHQSANDSAPRAALFAALVALSLVPGLGLSFLPPSSPHSFLSSRYYLLIVLVLIIYLALLG